MWGLFWIGFVVGFMIGSACVAFVMASKRAAAGSILDKAALHFEITGTLLGRDNQPSAGGAWLAAARHLRALAAPGPDS